MIRNQRRARAISLAALSGLVLLVAAQSAAADEASGPRVNGTVNINTATAEQLQLLPGIGESRARAVIALRKSRGGFKSIDELSDVKGIGDTALAKLRPFARTEGKTTATPN